MLVLLSVPASALAQNTSGVVVDQTGLPLPGVQIDVDARREYLDGPLLSQLLGYTGPIAFPGFGISGDRRELHTRTIQSWKTLSVRAVK